MTLTRRMLLPLCALGAFSLSALGQQIQISRDNRTIAITATATAKAEADAARVHIGFAVYGPSAAEAYRTGSQTSAAIMAALTKAGVPKSAIESEAQSISEPQPYEVQNLPPEERERRRFMVQQSWTVQSAARDASSVLNLAVHAGANKSGQIEWTLADEDSLQAQAASNALRRARQVAEQMASGLSAPLGQLIYASNEAPEPPAPFRARKSAVQAVVGGSFGASATPPLAINPQQVVKTATVYAVFALQ